MLGFDYRYSDYSSDYFTILAIYFCLQLLRAVIKLLLTGNMQC